jgi:hypothetical protein
MISYSIHLKAIKFVFNAKENSTRAQNQIKSNLKKTIASLNLTLSLIISLFCKLETITISTIVAILSQ